MGGGSHTKTQHCCKFDHRTHTHTYTHTHTHTHTHRINWFINSGKYKVATITELGEDPAIK